MRLFVTLVTVLVVRGFALPAQDPAPAKTTESGVYTEEQAKRGEETYMNICVSCHTATEYKNKKFRTKWDGRPLSELYDLISQKMPDDAPGSLMPKEYAQALAYILRLNEAAPGKTELPSDSAALKDIKIDFKEK